MNYKTYKDICSSNINRWTRESILCANEKDYLDQLYRVYSVPVARRLRIIPDNIAHNIESYYNQRNYDLLIKELLKLPKFPIEYPYIGFLRKDVSAVERNPETIQRIGSYLCNDMDLAKIFENISAPEKASRTMGHLFADWIETEPLGLKNFCSAEDFLKCKSGVLVGTDQQLKDFAIEYLGYEGLAGNKGLDFIAKRNNIFIVGEAKFITDAGGTQDKSFKDIILRLNSKWKSKIPNTKIIPIGILDGTPYLCYGQYNHVFEEQRNNVIVSVLFLRDFIFSL